MKFTNMVSPMLGRRGVALLQVLLFMIITTIFLATGTQFVSNSLKEGRTVRRDEQLYNVAMAGLNHAISWLKRQTAQPVTVFDPKANANLPDEEPETPASEEPLGLVNEFVIDAQKNTWGRYEVARSLTAPARSPLPTPGPQSSYYPGGISWYAEDIGQARGRAAGDVWRIRSRGYLFTKANGYTFATDPHRRLLTLEAEVHRTSPKYRAAALYSFWNSTAADSVVLDAKSDNKLTVDVTGGTARPWWTWTAQVTENGIVSKAAPLTPIIDAATPGPDFVDPSLASQLSYIFGVSDTGAVKSMATVVVDLAKGDMVPQPMPANKFVYIKGDPDFDGSSLQLDGSGILFVEGDLKIDAGTTEQKFTGLIFATGKYTQKSKSTINGAVIAGNEVVLEGDDSEEAAIHFSQSDIESALNALQEYRLEHSTIRVLDDGPMPSPY